MLAMNGEKPYPPLYVPAASSWSLCEVTNVASKSTIKGSAAVAWPPGSKFPAASQALDRSSRVRVSKP